MGGLQSIGAAEQMALARLLAMEQRFVKQYKHYADMAKEPQMKLTYEQIAANHQGHLQTLLQPFAKDQKAGHVWRGFGQQDFFSQALSSQQMASSCYHLAAFFCRTPVFRSIVLQLLEEEHQLYEQLASQGQKLGWSAPEATGQAVEQIIQPYL